nr:MAG TPA: hypothetical protein [Caudoviricetes sp.]
MIKPVTAITNAVTDKILTILFNFVVLLFFSIILSNVSSISFKSLSIFLRSFLYAAPPPIVSFMTLSL